MNISENVRPSPIAGHWYSSNPIRLASEVDSYLNAAVVPPLPGKIIGLMVPHAGYIYSGPVAGYGFTALRGLKPDVVAVISPMHHPYYEPILTTAHSAYATPLGLIQVDEDALRVLSAHLYESAGLRLARLANDPEHSLEIELPFLQRVIQNKFTLIPIMVRDPGAKTTRALGQALAFVLQDRSAILVASTDLSHRYTQDMAMKLDAEILREVDRFNPQGVLDAEIEGRGYACGRGALAAVMWAAKAMGADHAQVLRHATSGDVTGDYSEVVGYGAAVFTRLQVDQVK